MEKSGSIGRHELKHRINTADMIQLKARLPYVADTDAHADEQGGYRVRSLYFENYDNKALREKLDGVSRREKFRLRFYNDVRSFIRLEKKCKIGGLCYKESTTISREICDRLIHGDYTPLRDSGDPLMLELYIKQNTQLLRPRYIVDYRRDAYVYRAGNVRVTLDYDIRSSQDPSQFLEPKIVTLPVLDTAILEVKYDAFLPELIRGMTALGSRQQAAFSKYAAARMI